MITQAFSYNGITFDPMLMRGGFKAQAVVLPQISLRQLILNLAGQNGVESYHAYLGQLVIQIKGEVRGTTETDLYNKIDDLVQAFNPTTLEALGNDGFQALATTEGDSTNYYYVKPFRSMPVFQERNQQGLTVPFQCLLFAKDPVKYTQTTQSLTIAQAGTALGTSNLPQVLPMQIASSTYVASGTAVNSGTSDVYPTLVRINGPVTGPKIENSTDGNYYAFTTDVALLSGEKVEVDMARNTAYKTDVNNTVTSVLQYRTGLSAPFKIKQGNNTINFTSSGTMGTNANAVLQWLQPR